MEEQVITQELITLLEKYGKVDNVKYKPNEGLLSILITDGFSGKATDTLQLMSDISEITKEEFPIIKRAVTDKDKFDYVLSKV